MTLSMKVNNKTPTKQSPGNVNKKTPKNQSPGPNAITKTKEPEKMRLSKGSKSPFETPGRKRKHEDQGVDLDSSWQSLTPEPSQAKRPRTKKHTQDTNPTTPASIAPSKQSSDIGALPGQKVAVLAMIRNRLAELNARMVYIRRLPKSTTLAHLKTLCPTSVNARLPINANVSRRKYAFVEFKSEKAAKDALKAIDGKLVADKPIKAELCSQRSTQSDADKNMQWSNPEQRQLRDFSLTALYVCCIPRSTSEDTIKELFPTAASFDFNFHKKGKGICSCRVIFASEEDALKAFCSTHNAIVQGCPIVVNFPFKSRHRKPKAQDATETTRVKASEKELSSASDTPLSKKRAIKHAKSPKGDRSFSKQPVSKKHKMKV